MMGRICDFCGPMKLDVSFKKEDEPTYSLTPVVVHLHLHLHLHSAVPAFLRCSAWNCNVAEDLSERAELESSRPPMEVSSRLQSLLRPLLRLPSRTTGRALQTLALRPPPPPPRLPPSLLLLRLPPPHPASVPPRLLLLRPFASVSPAPVPGRDHLDSKDQGPSPAPLPPPPPEELASDDEAYYHEHLLEVAQENQTRVVPVKAFFLCTR